MLQSQTQGWCSTSFSSSLFQQEPCMPNGLNRQLPWLGDRWSAICSAGPRPSELVAVAFFLALTLRRLDPNFFVVLFECREVLARLGELALLHALSDVPMHEGSLRIHEVEFVVNAREDLGDRCGVADHATSAHDLGQIAA